MKSDVLRTPLTAAVLAFFTAWGALGCLTSAFGLSLQTPYAPLLVCGITAAGAALLLSFRHGGLILLCLLALAAGCIHRDGTALVELKRLITQLSTIYDRAYGWGILSFPPELVPKNFVDWPLCIWGALVALSVCCCVCRQKTLWLPFLVTVLPLCSCIVVTDTVPDEPFLLMVMTCLILLMLTSPVRRENAPQADCLAAAALLPVLLALGGLFLAVPQDGYVNHSEVFRQNILTAARNLPQLLETGMGELASGLQAQPPKQVDLAALGDRIPFTYPVMEVTAETSGTLYLREQDYDRYDGLGWKSSENREEPFSSAAGQAESIHIRTRTGKLTRYLPYHPATAATLAGGAAENPEKEQDYAIPRNMLPENWRQTAYENAAGTTAEWEAYLALPERTRQEAAAFLGQLHSTQISNTAKADIIAALVTDSARYDTQPGKMPGNETDFALWFLREGEAGYCVHFATAATVLLRAAGVPARYVTGYLLEAEAGTSVTVTEENAHAWAEYYEPNLGLWLPLEATPASQTPVQTRPRPSVTEPAETAETTQATVPTESQTTPTQALTESTHPAETLPPAATPAEASSPVDLRFLILLSVLVLLPLQRSVRLSVRRRRMKTGSPNQQALRRWQEALRLSRLLKESPTEELIHLAQKAKFSQYELTAEELQQFDSFQRTCLRRLKERPWYLRLIYRYLFAAY